MCTFEESCNCNSDRLLMQAELHSAQILKPAKKRIILLLIRFTSCNQIKERSVRLAQECHQEQPWEQLSLERRFTVKAVLLFVGIYISNKAEPHGRI